MCYGVGMATMTINDPPIGIGAIGAWRPIETAPKDGTQIMVWRRSSFGSGYFRLDRWTRDWREHEDWEGNREGQGEGSMYPPTHWTPLPTPPA